MIETPLLTPGALPAATGQPWQLPAYQSEFCDFLKAEPGIHGRVLDIGCGGGLTDRFSFIPGLCEQLDGVDPSPEVTDHPALTKRWHSRLEDADIPNASYDLAYAYNVLEHVARPQAFLKAVHRLLKPAGCFWALTPGARHPFVWLASAAETAGLKPLLASRNDGINDYGSPYRLNTSTAVARACQGIGFRRPEFHFASADWFKTYLPRWSWALPQLYEATIARWVAPLRAIMMVRLQKL
jgi:SAM-dependent methyltransferase